MKKHISLFLLTTSLLLSSCALTNNDTSAPASQEEATTSQTTSVQESSSAQGDSSESVSYSNIEASSSEEVISSSEEQSSSIDGSESTPPTPSHTHTWDAGTITTPATCTSDGEKTYHCTGCSETKTEKINKTGHSLEHHAANAATTTAPGNIEYWECTTCHDRFSDENGETPVYDIVVPVVGVKYTITWKNDSGTTIDTEQVDKGVVPSHAAPTKADDSTYTYTFKEWKPEIIAANNDATYTAVFEKYEKHNADYFPNTVFFTNSKGWSHVYVYAWNDTSNNGWPGSPMVFHQTNKYGQDVYSFTGLSTYKNIIFNNGSSGGENQSVDISAASLPSDKNAYYLKDTKTGGKWDVGTWYESGDVTTNYNFPMKGQNIIHCFDWKISTIMANLDEIASQGFTAIQTSPLQPVKDYTESYNDTNATWWRFYQPVGLCIGNSTSNILFDTADGAAELTALTEAAAQRGIRVIVDVIVNHLADGSGNGGLNPQVQTFSPNIYNNYTSTLHNPNGKVAVNSSTVAGIVKSDAFGKDLNTANSTVQNEVKAFLKSLVDCGVTGFRFDAAKHIETKYDGGGCGSSFWENTLGYVCTYASSTLGRNIWTYGEIISPGDAGRSYYQYLNDAWFYAVSAKPGWYDLPANNCVSWGESHDDYMSDRTTNSDTGQDNVNANYKSLAQASKDTNLLYFVRPDVTAKISAGGVGYHADWGWQNGQVKIANAR